MYDYLEHAIRDCGMVEVRHNIRGRWESGLFNDLPSLLKAIQPRLEEGALYCTLNKPTARAVSNSFGVEALRNDDMEYIRRIPMDFDPDRPAGVSSTDAELEAAIECRNDLARMIENCTNVAELVGGAA
jgi:hypothetical protein